MGDVSLDEDADFYEALSKLKDYIQKQQIQQIPEPPQSNHDDGPDLDF